MRITSDFVIDVIAARGRVLVGGHLR